jgi:hypothetical protein
MQARTYRRIESFDGAVRQLRAYFEQLQRTAGDTVPTPHSKRER